MKVNKSLQEAKIHHLSLSPIEINDDLFTYKKHGKLVIAQGNTYHLLSFKDIICLKSDSNYTYIYLVNGSKLLISKTLKEFTSKLDNTFMRVHRSNMINMNHIVSFDKGKGIITLTNENSAMLSRSNKSGFLKKMGI